MSDLVNHPSHYGGKDNPWEARKVIRDWGLGFELGNAFKYVYRWRLKHGVQDLEKAYFYVKDAISFGSRFTLIFESEHSLNVELLITHMEELGFKLSMEEKAIYRALWLMPEYANKYRPTDELVAHLVGMRTATEQLIAYAKKEL